MQEELQFGFPILTFLTFFPFFGAMVIWALKDQDLIRKSVLGIASLEMVVASLMLWRFVPETAAMQFAERHEWIPFLGISYHLAVDGISVLFVGLNAFLILLLVLYAWDTVHARPKAFYMCLLGMEATMMGIFVSIDLILFFCILGTYAHPQLFPD